MDLDSAIQLVEATEPSPDRGRLLSIISNTVVGLYKRYYGKGPTKARSYYVDDMVVCVLRGGLTRAEVTLAESGRGDLVTRQRHDLQQAIRGEFIRAVEDLVGRRVIAYISGTHTYPDVSVEVFMLEPEAPA